MYVFTWDQNLASANMNMSVDDGAFTSGNKTVNTPNNANAAFPLTIMQYANNAGANMNANITEYSIWDRVLSAEEITLLFNNGDGRSIY